MKKIFIIVIKGYQLLISPILPPACGFHPNCSEYAAEAVDKHGALKGSYYAFRRLLRCNPFHKGGFDPVP